MSRSHHKHQEPAQRKTLAVGRGRSMRHAAPPAGNLQTGCLGMVLSEGRKVPFT